MFCVPLLRMTPRRLAHSNRTHKRLVSQVTFRKYLRKHMLTLFSDFALLMPNESYVADLGSLLPAVAAARCTARLSWRAVT